MRSPIVIGTLSLLSCASCVFPEVLEDESLGERAATTCPADEVCSPAAPEGLHFYGPGYQSALSLAPQWRPPVGAIARGGLERVRIPLPAEADVQVTAETSTSALQVVSVDVDGARELVVTLSGVTAGSGHLRILDAQRRLLDRRMINVEEIAEVRLDAAARSYEGMPWGVMAGRSATVAVTLVGVQGRLVVDEALRPVEGRPSSAGWDFIVVDAPESRADSVLELAFGDGHRVMLPLPVVQRVESVEAYRGRGMVLADRQCFVARGGGRVIVGAHWEFLVSAGGALSFADTGVVGSELVRCVSLPGPGATLEVRVEDQSLSY